MNEDGFSYYQADEDMQTYTDLSDVNDKWIYEGDLLCNINIPSMEPLLVSFYDGSFVIHNYTEPKGEKIVLNKSTIDFLVLSIIGNNYEGM